MTTRSTALQAEIASRRINARRRATTERQRAERAPARWPWIAALGIAIGAIAFLW
jgi:hypothetical protein